MSRNVIFQIYQKLFRHYGPQFWWPGKTKFEIIVGAILTQNTAWRNVEKAIKNLKDRKLLFPDKLFNLPVSDLANLIRPTGYYNIKAKRLKSFLEFLAKRYQFNLTRMNKTDTLTLRQELLSVKGIGEETADSILLYAFNRPVFVVDAYTRRVFSRHKFFSSKATYSEIQKFFTANLPKDVKIYNEYHALIIRLAKEHCKKVPNCEQCPLANMVAA
ncbi:MAG: endonuclease III domain-containing protein [candidate division WOR-3 bacterium]